MKKIKKALISVSSKKNLSFILKILKKYNIQLISSGGTYKEIKKLGFNCIEISKYTGSKEILGGRVKTLHPKIHAGILSVRNNKSHIKDLVRNNFEEIDLVIVNFYPFEKTLKDTNNHKKIIENIDIGGPALVRAAAKNYNSVTVLTDLNQYNKLANELKSNNGNTTMNFRQKMAEQAFTETAYYDSIITNYLNIKSKNIFPNKKIFYGNIVEKLRYGENPHQDAAIYSLNNELKINQLNGKKLSYNNYNDIFSALLISKSLPKNTGTVIVKHANPEFKHYLYDDKMCAEFIKNNFHDDVYKAFNKLKPGAYKADLWRYCVLYIHGGVYMDIKFQTVEGFKLISIIEKEHFVKDLKESGNGIYNAFMISYPKNPTLLEAIGNIVINTQNNYYGEGPLSPTGPILLKNI